MSGRVLQPPWVNSPLLGSDYIYNPRTDDIILRNGTRFPGPSNIPLNSLRPASYDGLIPHLLPFKYTASPLGQSFIVKQCLIPESKKIRQSSFPMEHHEPKATSFAGPQTAYELCSQYRLASAHSTSLQGFMTRQVVHRNNRVPEMGVRIEVGSKVFSKVRRFIVVRSRPWDPPAPPPAPVTFTTRGAKAAANRLAKATKYAVSRKHVLYEPSLPARLAGHHVSAFPDTGAAANLISLEYARGLGLSIDYTTARHVKNAIGALIGVVGTTTLPFSFEGERKSYQLEFNVIRHAVHDVVIGNPFLNYTETFTRYAHRIKRKLRKSCLPRLCFLESQQQVSGWINGTHVNAVPDTGAEVSVMSASFAKKQGFVVDKSRAHRIPLALADGSTVKTTGVVKNLRWLFGSSAVSHCLDVYVLKGLETDLVLNYTFLHDTDAFNKHKQDFDVKGRGEPQLVKTISVIKMVDTALESSRWKHSGKQRTLISGCTILCHSANSCFQEFRQKIPTRHGDLRSPTN
jgi:hypothetical protein